MTAFPDLVVHFDSLEAQGYRAIQHWTLEGHATGPGGTGNGVRISGFEDWRMGEDGFDHRVAGSHRRRRVRASARARER